MSLFSALSITFGGAFGDYTEREILNRLDLLFFLSFGSAQDIWGRVIRTFSISVFGAAIQDDRHRFSNGETFYCSTQNSPENKTLAI